MKKYKIFRLPFVGLLSKVSPPNKERDLLDCLEDGWEIISEVNNSVEILYILAKEE